VESYRWLLMQKPDTALMLGCCGAPAEWAGEKKFHGEVMLKLREDWLSLGKPKAIFACPTCQQMFQHYLPEIEGIFLYELFIEWGISISQEGAGEIVSVFDPCSSRKETELQQSVRQLAKQAGFQLDPLPMEGKFAQCCSWGGHASIASPFHSREVVKSRISQNDNTYITYCVNCRDIFASAQKPVYHILDILFEMCGPGRVTPTVTERRYNRIGLKQGVLKEFWKDEVKMESPSKINLQISPQIKDKLNREMILETDIAAVIEQCESSGRKIWDPESGHFTGHLQIGNFTYWAEYLPVENGFELFNAYGHRMSIEEV